MTPIHAVREISAFFMYIDLGVCWIFKYSHYDVFLPTHITTQIYTSAETHGYLIAETMDKYGNFNKDINSSSSVGEMIMRYMLYDWQVLLATLNLFYQYK